MIRRIGITGFLLLCTLAVNAQSFNIEDIKNMFGKGNPLKLTGGFSANSTFNAGSEDLARDPFVYYLNGNINLNIYGNINLPFSFSLTNSGTSYKLPSSPNRLSIHPSYKWITGHIGDVSMTFSPYTLNGHIFTGAGVELSPDGWEFAAMYGRLLKAVEYDEAQPAFLPTYKRMGYGFKAGRQAEKYRISINVFDAKDNVSSLITPPDSLGVTPMENLAGSVTFLYKPAQFIEISGEYGLSLLTLDTRSLAENRDGIMGMWNASNMSSTYYKAFKAQINYVGETNRFGIGCERIDPGYKTLGAYYFANDLENITLNAYQAFLQNKMNINLSLGYERDDLDNAKASASSRIVGSANVTVMPNERINANLSYSNFQTYTNVRSNFELINQENPLDKLDTLNFVQLSQSANLNVNIITRKNEAQSHSLNINLSYQDAANKQGGVYHIGSVTEMINAMAAYSWTFLKSGLTLNGAVNLNNSKILNGNTLTWGPTLGASTRLLKKKINLSGSLSYNAGSLEGVKQNEVFLCRINSSYSFLKRQSLTLAFNYQWRSAFNRPGVNNSLLTLGYTCSF
ncbi:MAG: hypothetical protein LBR64_05790 [Dysgonamonadaceae bacterium]|jgi:hypothetical protein|nr:hypothetical protein [Dysgonamonadaceae bacterium]